MSPQPDSDAEGGEGAPSPGDPGSQAPAEPADSPEDQAFEAELRAEVAADVQARLADEEASQTAQPSDGAPRIGAPRISAPRISAPRIGAEEEEEVQEGEPWEDPFDDDDDPENGVVLRPFPGTGAHNPFVGSGNLVVGSTHLLGAFDAEPDPSAGYLVGELPGEPILTVEGPPASAGNLALALAVVASFAPCLLFGLGGEEFFPPDERPMQAFTALGAALLGLVLAVYLLNRIAYDPGRAIVTSEGIGLQLSARAAWLPWDELWSYVREEDVISLCTEQGEFNFLATEEEAGALIDLLDRKGFPRQRVSTRPPQPPEGAPRAPEPGGGSAGSEAL